MATGQARVLSSCAEITVVDYVSNQNIKVGEFDSFSASSQSSVVKSRPIGTALESPHIKYGGYEITMKGRQD